MNIIERNLQHDIHIPSDLHTHVYIHITRSLCKYVLRIFNMLNSKVMKVWWKNLGGKSQTPVVRFFGDVTKPKGSIYGIFWVVPLPRIPVTTGIIIFIQFLIGDPDSNLHLPLQSWEGGQPKVYLPTFG